MRGKVTACRFHRTGKHGDCREIYTVCGGLCVAASSVSLFREKCKFFFNNKIFVEDNRKHFCKSYSTQ